MISTPASRLLVATLLVAAWTQETIAATPDAGVFSSEANRLKENLPTVSLESDQTPTDHEKAKASTDVSLTVNSFEFIGNTLIDTSSLSESLSHLIGKNVGMSDLMAATHLISEAYRKNGWLARAYFPEQEITSGYIRLHIEEALFGHVTIEKEDWLNFTVARANSYVQKAQKPSEAVNMHRINRSVLLLNDLPGVNAEASLYASNKKLVSNLSLKLAADKKISGNITLDNHGHSATGELRTLSEIIYNNPRGIGDQVSADLKISKGNRRLGFQYTTPVSTRGLTTTLAAGALQYDLTGSGFGALDAEGSTYDLSLALNYPLLRSKQFNVFGQVKLENKTFTNKAAGETVSDYGSQNLSLRLSTNRVFRTRFPLLANASLGYISGTLDHGEPDSGEDADLDEKYGISEYQLGLTSRLNSKLSVSLNYSGQTADTTLDSSQNFSLGGPDAVKAFPVSEASGSTGSILTAALSYQLSEHWHTTLFVNQGSIQQRMNEPELAEGKNEYSLEGAGIGLSRASRAWLFSASLSNRLQDHPNPLSNGDDQDGSLKEWRFWTSLSWRF